MKDRRYVIRGDRSSSPSAPHCEQAFLFHSCIDPFRFPAVHTLKRALERIRHCTDPRCSRARFASRLLIYCSFPAPEINQTNECARWPVRTPSPRLRGSRTGDENDDKVPVSTPNTTTWSPRPDRVRRPAALYALAGAEAYFSSRPYGVLQIQFWRLNHEEPQLLAAARQFTPHFTKKHQKEIFCLRVSWASDERAALFAAMPRPAGTQTANLLTRWGRRGRSRIRKRPNYTLGAYTLAHVYV